MSDSSVYLAAEQVRVAIINTNHIGTKKNIILKRSANCCCILVRSAHLARKLPALGILSTHRQHPAEPCSSALRCSDRDNGHP